ncbi:hypothetical protein pipiens_015494 [Culex pipiens pipiens]|uniref:Uncharacterized protein n=1 Tax=Culex pipiens pipiens TaxID=38569 RepID=A0ABD1CQE3_CULPP
MTATDGHRTDLYDGTSLVAGQPSLHGMLKAICAAVFDKSDAEYPPGLPTLVCANCRNAILAAFKLHQTCIETDRRLGELLALKWELQDLGGGGESGDPLRPINEKGEMANKSVELGGNVTVQIVIHPGPNDQNNVSCSMRDLYNHKASHVQQRTHICDICGSKFAKQSALKRHVKLVHEGLRPFECQICGFKLFTSTQLKRHLLGHSKEKPYKCELCTQAFVKTDELANHVARKHRGGLPYPCDRCDESFRLMAELRHHYRVHVQAGEQIDEMRFTAMATLQRIFARDKQKLAEEGNAQAPDPVTMQFDQTGDTTKLCRVCMTAKEGHRTDLYDTTSLVSGQPSLHGMLKAVCAPVFEKTEADHRPGMPTKVCSICRNAILAAFKLHQTCIETDRRLGELLAVKRELQDLEHNDGTGDPLGSNSKETLRDGMLNTSDEVGCVKTDGETRLLKEEQPKEEKADSLPEAEHVEPVVCSECGKTMANFNSLRMHLRVGYCSKQKDQPPTEAMLAARTCKVCGELQKTRFAISGHMKVAHPDRMFRCDICGKEFQLQRYLDLHKVSHGPKTYLCPTCNETLPTKEALKKHRRTHKAPITCNVCGKVVATNYSLSVHMERHVGLKPFACDNCPMRFFTKAEIRGHMLTHTKKQDHVCDLCGSRFTTNHSLKKHVIHVHEGQRPFPCSLCSLKFAHANQLQRHMYTHTGEKPHKCELCPQAYAQTNDLVKHVARAHGDGNPYLCDLCDEGFRLLTDLRQHYRVHVQSTEGGADQMEEVRFTSVAILKRAFAKAKQRLGIDSGLN